MSERKGNAIGSNSRLGSIGGRSNSRANFSRFATVARDVSASYASASMLIPKTAQTASVLKNSAGVWRRSTKMLTDTPISGYVAPQYRAADFAALDMGRQPETRRHRGLSPHIKTPISPENVGYRRSLSSSDFVETNKIGGVAK